MATFQQKQASSRLERSTIAAIAAAQANVSVTSTASTINAGIYQVRYVSSLPTYINFKGETAATSATTAANASTFIPANTIEYLSVTPGQTLSYTTTSASSGYISMTEVS